MYTFQNSNSKKNTTILYLWIYRHGFNGNYSKIDKKTNNVVDNSLNLCLIFPNSLIYTIEYLIKYTLACHTYNVTLKYNLKMVMVL